MIYKLLKIHVIFLLFFSLSSHAGALIKKAQNVTEYGIEDLYSEILKERKRNVHPYVIIRSKKFSNVLGGMESENAIREQMSFVIRYASELNPKSLSLRDVLDFKYVNDKWNEHIRGQEHFEFLSRLSPKDVIRTMDTFELFEYIKAMEANTFYWNWHEVKRKTRKSSGQSFDYVFGKESVEALGEQLLSNPKLLDYWLSDKSHEATLARFRILENLATKQLLNKEMRIKFIESFSSNDYMDLNRMLSQWGFTERFFNVLALMKKEDQHIRNKLVHLISRYPNKAEDYLMSQRFKSDRKAIDGFASVLFRASGPGIANIQRRFLKSAKFHLSTESAIFHASKAFNATGGIYSEAVSTALESYRKQAGLLKRCTLAFKRR